MFEIPLSLPFLKGEVLDPPLGIWVDEGGKILFSKESTILIVMSTMKDGTSLRTSRPFGERIKERGEIFS